MVKKRVQQSWPILFEGKVEGRCLNGKDGIRLNRVKELLI